MGRAPEQTFSQRVHTYAWPTGAWKGAWCQQSSEKCKRKPQWNITSHLLGWLFNKQTKNRTQNKCWQGHREKGVFAPLGNVNWDSCYGRQHAGTYKIKNRTTPWSNNPTSGYRFKETQISISERQLHSVFTATLFTVPRKWRHMPPCTHVGGGGYYSALKRRIFCHCRQRGWVWRAFTVKQTRQRKTNSVWYHLYVEFFKERTSKLTESKIKQWLLMGWEHGGTGERLVKGCKPTVTRWVGSENLMCSTVTDLS